MKHGPELGIATEAEYEEVADRFMFGPMGPNTRECRRMLGDRLRCEMVVRHFGVSGGMPEVIRTFYPIRASKIHRHGGIVGFFTFECGRIDL